MTQRRSRIKDLWLAVERSPHAPWITAALHGLLAGLLWLRGMNFATSEAFDSWDWMWQVIKTEDLLQRPWSSLWYLHAQPPGFSLWGLFWLRLFGEANFPASMQAGYVLLGMATVAMTWSIARAIAGRRLALIAALGMALNPSLFLYEAYTLYEMLVIALVVGSAACLLRVVRSVWLEPGRTGAWLAGFVVVLNTLVLTRSLYHWIFLWAALAFAWPAWRRWRRPARIALLLLAVAPPGLWYAKNQYQYGFFGASSWFGIGLFKVLIDAHTYQELVDLRDEGVIPFYVEQRYSYEHDPSDYIEFGFDETSEIPLLNRDDFHNINMIAIAKGYEEASIRVIRRNPLRYLYAVYLSYCAYSAPPSRFGHLERNRMQFLGMWEPFVADILYGALLTDWYKMLTHVDFGSLYFFYFPFIVAGAAWWTLRRWRGRSLPRERMRAWMMAYALFVVLYVTAIGCMFELGENMRFRFATEPLTLIMTLVLLRATWRRVPVRWKEWLTPRIR